jgi:hypothetical protein
MRIFSGTHVRYLNAGYCCRTAPGDPDLASIGPREPVSVQVPVSHALFPRVRELAPRGRSRAGDVSVSSAGVLRAEASSSSPPRVRDVVRFVPPPSRRKFPGGATPACDRSPSPAADNRPPVPKPELHAGGMPPPCFAWPGIPPSRPGRPFLLQLPAVRRCALPPRPGDDSFSRGCLPGALPPGIRSRNACLRGLGAGRRER